MLVSFQLTRTLGSMFLLIASVSMRRPFRNEPTVCPAGLAGKRVSRGGGGLFLRSWNSLMAPPTRLPPSASSDQMRPKAAFMESLEGSPAYTPEQKGSMRRSKTSAPRLRRINCSTLSSYAGGGPALYSPTAPSPARILPHRDRRSNVTASKPEGVARSFFSQKTKRGALGSPNTRSLSMPASTAICSMESLGWKLLGPSSHT
mmetsp:Transcript_23311/g.69238  ORF Transcript_23311/g.69238 Transcript_23311/m.69238 type:complete len:203 (-) Transcript_23311:294-902(-)